MSDFNLPLMTFTEASERAAAARERELFAADNAQGDADVAEFERRLASCGCVECRDGLSAEIAKRQARRVRRRSENSNVAAACFLLIGVLLLPTMFGRYPVETVSVLASIIAMALIARAARCGNPEW
jgi:hypothetical protein